MTVEKHICCSIMICEMTAILSGVSLLYLSVLVTIPSKKELEAGFHETPIMCTTTNAEDIAAKGKKVECSWTTCSEWCLSKGAAVCVQIHVMPRNNGSRVNFTDCVDIYNQQCSALDVNLSLVYRCKKGQCKELTGLYVCDKEGENLCREITPGYMCHGSINRNTTICTEEKCDHRLHGVYACKNGECNKIESIRDYSTDCTRKCTNLKMHDRNVILFSKERMVATACQGIQSSDNNTINDVNTIESWHHKQSALFVFCTYFKKQNGLVGYDLIAEDCFNATMADGAMVSKIDSYIDLLNYHYELSKTDEWFINPEQDLRIMNDTQLRINPEGCVNTLQKECKAFFMSHAHDGRDGITPDRFPCYFTDKTTDYVIGKYNPALTALYLTLATALPGSLFVLSCACLFLCSKAVGVDNEGHLQVILLKGRSSGDKDRGHFDDLL